MVTKANEFRAATERAAQAARPRRPRKAPRNVPVDTAAPGVSATDRKVGAGSTATRNLSARAAKKGGARLEDSATGRPSRKSTRKSLGRARPTSSLERRQIRRAGSVKAKAVKATAGKAKGRR